MTPDGSSDMAANAWPGFVDILSAVVIMFVFFVLITSAVLYFYTITYKAKVAGQPNVEVVAALPSLGAANIEELEAENSALKKQIESAQAQASQGGGTDSTAVPSDTQSAAQAFGAQASEQQVTTSTENRSMVLFHDPGAITVDDLSEEKIAQFINELAEKYGAENLEVTLTSPKTANAATQSRAKRLAVARMLNVRNSLLSSPLDREKIQLNVVESEAIEDSANWTRLQINIRQ